MSAWRSAAAGLLMLVMPTEVKAQPPSAPALPPLSNSSSVPPTYTIKLNTRHACVTPTSQCLARADGGFIDILAPAPNTVTMTMTGTVAANSYLCTTGMASEKFQLVQDLEITCSDPKQATVSLTIDTALAGFVRSKRKAGACVRLAQVCLTSVAVPSASLSLSYPPLCVEGTGGQLCNQHLPPLEAPVMPTGRYTLTATFVLDSTASGVCDSHAVADFSPDTTLPTDWVRTRDPFQSVSKKAFGFTATITASPPSKPEEGGSNAARDGGDGVSQRAAKPRAELVEGLVRRNAS